MKVLGWNQNGCIVFTVSWSRIYELSRMDFNADQLTNGQPFRTFNVLDDFDCEGLGIEVEVTLRSVRITRVLDRIIEWYGKPGKILCDNGLPAESTDIYLKNIPGTCTVPDNKSRPSAACT